LSAGPPVRAERAVKTLLAYGWHASLKDEYLRIDIPNDPDYTHCYTVGDLVPFSFIEDMAARFGVPIESFYDCQ
jgi:hypothetical protein